MSKHKKIFLVTTPIEDFWDFSRPMIFLGEWCYSFNRRHFLRSLNIQQLDSPYHKKYNSEDTYKYINNLYEEYLDLLYPQLNVIHKLTLNKRGWRILIGPWLFMYISSLYDRYIHIDYAIKNLSQFSTIGMSEESFIVPSDTLDFNNLILNDHYNLQIFTRLLEFFNVSFDIRIPLEIKKNKRNFLRYKHFFAKCLNILFSQFHNKILLHSANFSKLNLLKLFFNNFNLISLHMPIYRYLNESYMKKDKLKAPDNRIFLNKKIISKKTKSLFDLFLLQTISFDIPKCFIEEFNNSNMNAFCKANFIFSANGWYFDEHLKKSCAVSIEKGLTLLGTQHGGNYGIQKNLFSEEHELAIVDYYYSWGWIKKKSQSKIIPMPSTKFTGRKKLNANNSHKDILFGCASSPRYLYQYPNLPIDHKEYLNWQIRFYKAINSSLRSKILFRPHTEDYGWSFIDRLKSEINEVRISSNKMSFFDSLSMARIYVCDHISTTYIEALSANKPTILFYNPSSFKIRPESIKYFNLLEKVGILHKNPENASKTIDFIYDDIETWWNDKSRQKAIEIFCQRFAFSSLNDYKSWENELHRIGNKV